MILIPDSLDVFITIVEVVVALGASDKLKVGVGVMVGVSVIEGSREVSFSGWRIKETDSVGEMNVVSTAVVIMDVVVGGIDVKTVTFKVIDGERIVEGLVDATMPDREEMLRL